jgi:TonB-linked SusC/RagA family outer membrane protein
MKTILSKLLLSCLLLPLSILAQTVTGVVTDENKMPMPGVNVVVKGTGNGTSTDFDGKYKLSKLKKGDVIEFSYVGYTTKEVTYNNEKSLNVSLTEDAQQLKEVVLVSVGYGAVKKKDLTGSVTQISAKEFNKGANVTAENLLNGRVAGVTINTSGAPGSGSAIRIRGGSSLQASNDPLIVLDGLPLDASNVTGSSSILASINPNDIESMNVLKDASATAIYGSRAANGVIIINTKRAGKKLQFDFNSQYGSGNLVKKVDVFSADEYRNLIAGPITGTDLATGLPVRSGGIGTPAQIAQLGTANTDWQDEIYRRTDFVDNSLSVRGQLFNSIPTRLSIGNTYTEGLRKTNYFNRNSVALNLSPSLFKDHLKIRVATNYTNEGNRFAEGVEGAAIRFNPTMPVYSNSPYDGFFEYWNQNAANPELINNVASNPVAQLFQRYDYGKTNRFFGNAEFDYKLHFFPDVRLVVNLGYDEAESTRNISVSKNARGAGSFVNNNKTFGREQLIEESRVNKLFDAYFVYKKEIGKLNLDVTGGYSYQSFNFNSFNTNNINNPTDVARNFTRTPYVLIGYFGRTNINFKDKYLLTLSMRRDGTSRFLGDNRWGNFPSAAFAWKMKEEFFTNNKTVSDLKLRLGWGITGQQDIGTDFLDFAYTKYSTGNPNSQYQLGNISYNVGIPAARNPNLKWEETTTYNAGIDYGFFNNRITGSLEAYYKLSTDLLIKEAPFADGSNFSNQGAANIGEMSTKGIELTLNADVVKNDDGFNWNVNFNASKFERRVDQLATSDILLGGLGAGTGGTVQIHREGFTPSSFFVFKQLYDANNRPIEGAYADLNGDGIINASDKYIYRNADPDLVLGFASNMNYANFDFSFNLRASIGNRMYNGIKATRSSKALISQGASIENISPNFLNTGFNVQDELISLSDLFIENASFLRMDNISLGYTFNKFLEGKATLRLFTGVQNAFVITDYDGLDPEIFDGRDLTIYPRQRQYLFGLNLKF